MPLFAPLRSDLQRIYGRVAMLPQCLVYPFHDDVMHLHVAGERDFAQAPMHLAWQVHGSMHDLGSSAPADSLRRGRFWCGFRWAIRHRFAGFGARQGQSADQGWPLAHFSLPFILRSAQVHSARISSAALPSAAYSVTPCPAAIAS